MKVLVQIGDVGDSVMDHLVRPVAHANCIDHIHIVARKLGPRIPKTSYHVPPAAIQKSSVLAFLAEMLILLRLSLREKPDCIVGYLLFPHALAAFLVAKITGRAVVVALIAGPVELMTIRNSTTRKFDDPLSLTGRLLLGVLRRSDAVVTTGSSTRDFLVRHGMSADKVHPIIHTPDSSLYYPVDLKKEHDVLYVGRLAKVKHVETLLYAVQIARETLCNVRVCIVGEGPCEDELRNLASELGIADNVEFTGFRKDVNRYYNASRVLALTSEREGFPNVVLEAMMCGIPSVIADCGDVKDLARDGYNCLIIPRYDDKKALADGILRLLRDEGLRAEMSRNALETVKEFSMDKSILEWEHLIAHIMEENE